MENQHSVNSRRCVTAALIGLALAACHGAEPIVPGEPDPMTWAGYAVGDAGGDGADVRYVDQGPPPVVDAEVPEGDATLSGLCSMSGPATTWVVTNTRRRPVTLYWVDFACNEARYADIAPGATYQQGTFVTHVWRVRDTGDGHLITEVVLDMAPQQATEIR